MTIDQDTVDEIAEETHNQVLMLYGDVFLQLTSFERFNQFMELNYNMELETNHEQQSVRYNVVEKKSEDVVETLTKLVKQAAEEGSQLVTATGADLTKYSK